MELRKAAASEVPLLTRISDRALRTDALAAQRREEMYQGFDDRDWYARMQAHGDLYVLLDGERPVGGALAFYQNGRLYIERFFAGKASERRALLHALEAFFPDAWRIELDAPQENERMLSLLKECGFTPVRGNGDWIYCLKMPGRQIPASEFLPLSDFDGACVRVRTRFGEVFEGECSYSSEGFNDAELGIPEDGLQMDDLVIARSDILSVEEVAE